MTVRVVRVTGVQAYQATLARILELASEQLSPREYTVLLDIHGRHVDAERHRRERALRRWAA